MADKFSNDLPISAFLSQTLSSFRVLFLYLLYFMVDMAHLKERWVDISPTP